MSSSETWFSSLNPGPLPLCVKNAGLVSLAAYSGLFLHNVYGMKHSLLSAINRSSGGTLLVCVGTYCACCYGKEQERKKVIAVLQKAGFQQEQRARESGGGSGEPKRI